jgi:alcohol dehydrogenase, propanol-preferring
MDAVQLTAWQTEPELRDVPVPLPGPGEALVAVEAAGLCHTDLHIMDWPAGALPWELPFTLGHECAGTVASLGPGATGVAVGDRVVVYGPWGCGTCAQCVRGAENLCPTRHGRGAGCGLDGALAGYLRVPSTRLLVPIGDLDATRAAPLTDAALTPYHAIVPHLGRLRPGASVVVIGVGGLGHPAVQILRALAPAWIVAVDPRPSARDLALEAGADVALDSAGLHPGDVLAETRGGAALVLDLVGTDETLSLATHVLAMGGHLSVVGHGGGALPLAVEALPYDSSVGRPSWGTLPELQDVVALARGGALMVEVEVFALGEAIDAYRRLRAGEVTGRAVVVP